MTLAWSVEIDADVVAIIETIVASSDAIGTVVFDGRATQGVQPPFVTCWMLAPEHLGIGLAADCWGIGHQRWQISAHGATQGQARYLAEQIAGYAWPAGWELVEVGPMVDDTTDKPDTWFLPLTFVSRDMGGQATTGSGFDSGFDTGF